MTSAPYSLVFLCFIKGASSVLSGSSALSGAIHIRTAYPKLKPKMDQLKEYGEYLEDEIEKVPEISKVDIRGIQDKEIEISVDLYKMEISKICFNDIAMAIQNENMTISGGDLLENGIRRNVRIIS